MRFFVEEMIGREEKKDLTTEEMSLNLDYFAEKAFWRFAYFHECILPVGFYANCIQVKAIAHVCS